MIRDCYLLYVCPSCGEVSVFNGLCDNFLGPGPHPGERPYLTPVRVWTETGLERRGLSVPQAEV